MKTKISIFLLAITALQFHFSFADTTRRSPSNDGTFSAGPYYNEATKSYFELIQTNRITWREASILASNHRHKNTPGRLATINRPETHLFIVQSFNFTNNAWIGLRFFCEDSNLEWADGTSHIGARFSNWSPNAQMVNVMCAERGYVASYINRGAFDWGLNVNNQTNSQVLIEYPTGRK